MITSAMVESTRSVSYPQDVVGEAGNRYVPLVRTNDMLTGHCTEFSGVDKVNMPYTRRTRYCDGRETNSANLGDVRETSGYWSKYGEVPWREYKNLSPSVVAFS